MAPGLTSRNRIITMMLFSNILNTTYLKFILVGPSLFIYKLFVFSPIHYLYNYTALCNWWIGWGCLCLFWGLTFELLLESGPLGPKRVPHGRPVKQTNKQTNIELVTILMAKQTFLALDILTQTKRCKKTLINNINSYQFNNLVWIYCMDLVGMVNSNTNIPVFWTYCDPAPLNEAL